MSQAPPTSQPPHSQPYHLTRPPSSIPQAAASRRPTRAIRSRRSTACTRCSSWATTIDRRPDGRAPATTTGSGRRKRGIPGAVQRFTGGLGGGGMWWVGVWFGSRGGGEWGVVVISHIGLPWLELGGLELLIRKKLVRIWAAFYQPFCGGMWGWQFVHL